TAKQGRDRKFQAILPLRGKILNVEKAMDHKVFDNKEITRLFRVLRVSIGTEEDSKAVDISRLAFHKIIIMTDADVDGAHIATLLMTFFFRRMRPVIEQGHLYLATPPLYKITRGKESVYCYTDQERNAAIAKMGDRVTVQRYKGLGEMDAKELRFTTMSPEHRILKQVTINDAAGADRVFSMLMGEDVAPRRDFIEENAKYANIDA
ncbi:MAG: DNA topoisomerase IV subunit B, partial [Paramuribaculum sp.]|nr:DNA topoisomerase IV subunit B [Paramuribaculum sp.]